jgi:hypothetical protein
MEPMDADNFVNRFVQSFIRDNPLHPRPSASYFGPV